MPELPEVETCLRGLEPLIKHKQVDRIIVRQRKLRWPIPISLQKQLPGQKITRLERRAKYLLLHSPGGVLIIHLGMSASLRLLEQSTPVQKHDHVDIIFKDRSCLRYTDPRRFGALLWTQDDPHQHPLLAHLGPEPLSPAFTAKYLYQITRKRKTNIKTLLLNSKIVAGIGNIYAAEALFKAQIHPQRAVGKISLARYQRLVKAIRAVLRTAIKQGGSTLKDFYNTAGKPGYFQQQHQVYGRDGLACRRCQRSLHKIIIAQRTTVLCPYCQR